jgi:phosphate transport system permease protein
MTDLATPLPPSPLIPLAAEPARRRSSARALAAVDRITQGSALGGALLMVGLLILLLAVIGHGAMPAIRQFGWEFLTTSRWSAAKEKFGALPVIYGTLVSSLIALLIAVPISLGSAIFLTKLAPKLRIPLPNFRRGTDAQLTWVSPRHVVAVTSFLIELLAAIPSIAYGLWGVFVLVPFMQNTVQPALSHTLGHLPLLGPFFAESFTGYSVLTASLILSIMVTPIMTAIIRDVLAVAPPELEQGALGLGATWWQATRLVLGYSKMGILGAVILGFARAIGETMAVTMVIGNTMTMEKSLLEGGYTIASLLANQFREADSDILRHALVYTAFVLLVITTLINGVARVLVMRAAARGRRK